METPKNPQRPVTQEEVSIARAVITAYLAPDGTQTTTEAEVTWAQRVINAYTQQEEQRLRERQQASQPR
jgi:hypothetical protein